MKFAVIGGGVVGRCYGKALADSGATLCGVWDILPTQGLRDMTAAMGVSIHPAPGPWLSQADVVLSCVFGTAALDVTQQTVGSMRPGAIYVDMTTATPEDMAAAEKAATPHDVGFVDVAITGAVNMRGAKTPLLCAGQQAQHVADVFKPLGAPVKVVGSQPGDAARLKLLRSIFTKGLEALTVECLATAEVSGLRAPLHEVLLDLDQTPLQALMETLVVTHIEHAARRREEVIEAQHLMHSNGIQPVVLPAVQRLFERTVAELSRCAAPQGQVDIALKWLVESASQGRSPSPGHSASSVDKPAAAGGKFA